MSMRETASTGNGTRRAVAAVCAAGALALSLSGCAGFLVPAGEGEPGPTPSVSHTPGRVHAEKLQPRDLPSAPPATGDVPSPAPPPSAAARADCPSSGLVVDMGEVQAALGHRAVGLTLTNCGSKPYRVDGYPSVRVLDDEGEPLPVKVNPGSSYMGTDPGPKEVMLKPGQTLHSLLAWVSTTTGGDLIEGDALEIAPAPGLEARTFPLKGSDVRLLDELNMTAWRTVSPQ
ncbi:DUF4232 domain-containing protein [Streptomyces sp. NPDC002917]|uniref:DUF4232 domain-containing protein n=1 Tax=unclassified Streptomyces TaxID=2593676 RepID=UPI002E8073BA|nr:DUF4232 domain-containing protein [Streptomyces sp. NBC_00562]WTC82613.1 DUF4232 domain-containing protein [Streptomyces sp. NBC_01653]WTD32773.1 DUF4232 domain-containing protein [Streptomyces sp. NBC_01643]WTD88253.1 DUF4232 domain-containing protein [Streptomyces sp. NBC_01637]WUC19284.1 DUF4232 domain-containing protein [Streptomyces sp. NBC_00562]